MEYTEVIYLISQSNNYDDIGNFTPIETSKKVYAKESYVRTNEFYNAVSTGMKPSAELLIKKMNYNGEAELNWNNKRYKVIRTIPSGFMDLALIIEEEIGVTNNG